MRAGLAGAAVALAMATSAAAGILDGVERVGIDVEMAEALEGVSEADLRRRLVAIVREVAPGARIDAASQDRLRLTVAVRAYSSSTLRGFPLPFSGRYAIGTVRLGLQRPVHTASDLRRTVPAVLWQRERPIATRWSAAGRAIDDAVGELLDELRTDGRAGR